MPAMPLLEIAQNRPITSAIRLDETTAERIDQYRANLHFSVDEFVRKAPTYASLRHRDFQKFLRMMESRPAAEMCRKRRRSQNGTENDVARELLQPVAEAAKALETVRAPRPHG
jgi:hypothetical protein